MKTKDFDLLLNKEESKLNNVCSIIAKQTDENDHTGAKITCAKYFELKYYVRVFSIIEMLHTLEGSLPEELSNYRRRKGIEMMNYIKIQFPMQFDKINNSF